MTQPTCRHLLFLAPGAGDWDRPIWEGQAHLRAVGERLEISSAGPNISIGAHLELLHRPDGEIDLGSAGRLLLFHSEAASRRHQNAERARWSASLVRMNDQLDGLLAGDVSV